MKLFDLKRTTAVNDNKWGERIADADLVGILDLDIDLTNIPIDVNVLLMVTSRGFVPNAILATVLTFANNLWVGTNVPYDNGKTRGSLRDKWQVLDVDITQCAGSAVVSSGRGDSSRFHSYHSAT